MPDVLPIHPLTTGQVRIHTKMHRGEGTGLRRRAKILRKGPMGELLPIHAWLIEHPEGLFLIDAGETHEARSGTFAEFHVTRADELDHQLKATNFAPDDIKTVVLTHIHGDHIDGLPHVPNATVLANAREIAIANAPMGRLQRTVTRQPLPPGFAPRPFTLDGPALGAFTASKALTTDGRIVAVSTPGHTLGHIAILVVQPDHHVLLGGDTAYDQAQLQELRVDGVSPKDDVAIATMKTILAHAKTNPTVYLPSHDPQSVRRLRETDTL
ncbi:N-acyl homoserine lactonase family protein [Baekduia sp.]|jgi:glyoxylase-like metal-dependent hydrolase (beta-lactamase superfamily II)|uniref:N-acyl homoserine lactonase family protein n=1 Tax=Baekduia sp. TaxID=2600305 RepID=UPI002DF8B47F|nr:N-acyl homoserine lactonase family protein [Baekduia sp.]